MVSCATALSQYLPEITGPFGLPNLRACYFGNAPALVKSKSVRVKNLTFLSLIRPLRGLTQKGKSTNMSAGSPWPERCCCSESLPDFNPKKLAIYSFEGALGGRSCQALPACVMIVCLVVSTSKVLFSCT